MLILASGSPRRRELLEKLHIPFEIVVSGSDESVPEGIDTRDIPEYLAGVKAAEVLERRPDDVVIGSDTVVISGNEVLGKPKSEDDAFRMLKELSGRTHEVRTGVSIVSKEKKISFSSSCEVRFYELSDDEIRAYISTGEPMDKAGAYGIQGDGALLVKEIKGDYYTVMGLPVAELSRRLKDFRI